MVFRKNATRHKISGLGRYSAEFDIAWKRCPSDYSALNLEFSMFSPLAENGSLRITVQEAWNGEKLWMQFVRDVSSETSIFEMPRGVGLAPK